MRTLRHVFIACCVVGVTVGGFVCWQARANSRQNPPITPVASHHRKPVAAPLPNMSLAPSTPTMLRIDKLGVTAPVEGVGITKNGEMGEPRTATDATWYQYGYLPGALGNAVIAGHYLYESKPALFYRLHELVNGDNLIVTTDQQNAITFRVTDSQHYNADDAPFTEIFGASKKAQLRLVTCYGAWDKARQRYVERLVVTAEFVKESASSSITR